VWCDGGGRGWGWVGWTGTGGACTERRRTPRMSALTSVQPQLAQVPGRMERFLRPRVLLLDLLLFLRARGSEVVRPARVLDVGAIVTAAGQVETGGGRW
jgi:hypothetical protein